MDEASLTYAGFCLHAPLDQRFPLALGPER